MVYIHQQVIFIANPSLKKADMNKQDQILSTIGLKRLMIWQIPIVSVYDESNFKKYKSRPLTSHKALTFT